MPFWRLILGVGISSLLAVKAHSRSTYTLIDDYSPDNNFFDGFRFYTGGDPTNGFVQYVNRSYAEEHGLITTHTSYVTVGVDHTNRYEPGAGPGRPSVRLETLQTYTHGLFILSLNHMPFGCGTWPAFWTLGPDWPTHGEIDIIEGVNVNQFNIPVLHTRSGCTIAGANETGTLLTANCGNSNIGCGVQDSSRESYGAGFNKAGGGIYAMEWTSEYIRVWNFGPDDIPSSILSGKPDPSLFPNPAANFEGSLGSCDIDSFFGDHYIVFDITFCGDYAGNVYSDTNCPNASGGYPACKAFVGNNPRSFLDAYWSINYLRVYQQQGASSSANPSTVSLSSVTPAAVSSSAILSSLASGGMGVDSSRTRVWSSTLSVPKSKSSVKTHTTSSKRGGSSHSVTSRLKESGSSKTASTTSHHTQLNLTGTTSHTAISIPTFTDVPRCHSIFRDRNNVQFRVYCNATILGGVLRETSTSTFAQCIGLCGSHVPGCVGSTFTNSSQPHACVLRAPYSTSLRTRRASQISPLRDSFAALRLSSGAKSTDHAVRRSTSTSRESNTLESSSHRSQEAGSKSVSISISASTVGSMTRPISATRRSTAARQSHLSNSLVPGPNSICLCYTCGLVPIVVTTGCQASTQRYTSILSKAVSSSIRTPPPQTIPGACNVARTIIVTKVVRTTVRKCDKPLICPVKPTGLPPSSGPGNSSDGGHGLSGHIICTPSLAPGSLYTDAAGMVYQLYCGQTVMGPNVSEEKQHNFLACLAACDRYNFAHFETNGCRGVAYNRDTHQCQLKAESASRRMSLNSDSGILLSGISGGGAGGGSNGGGSVGVSKGSGLGSGNTDGHSGISTTAGGHLSYSLPTHISKGHTVVSTYGSATSSSNTPAEVQTSYLITTKVSNGHTIVSTYSSSVVPSRSSTAVSGLTHFSTIISKGHTSIHTVVSTLSNPHGSNIGGSGGANPTATSLHAVNPSVITITRHGKEHIITGQAVTITESGKVVTVTRHGQARTVTKEATSYEISYVFATMTVTTGGGGGGLSSSTSSSRTCRTAATHYAGVGMRKRKRSVLEGVLREKAVDKILP